MASTSALSLAIPPTAAATRRPSGAAAAAPLKSRSAATRFQIRASAGKNEMLTSGVTAAAIAAALAVPEIAEAAQPGISPSLTNFLLSIASGGLVLGVLVGAVVAVSNFDPVKRT